MMRGRLEETEGSEIKEQGGLANDDHGVTS